MSINPKNSYIWNIIGRNTCFTLRYISKWDTLFKLHWHFKVVYNYISSHKRPKSLIPDGGDDLYGSETYFTLRIDHK
jgi:hypothetical protein